MFYKLIYGTQGAKMYAIDDLVLRCELGVRLAHAKIRTLLTQTLRSLLCVLGFVALPALSAGLNDTGITTCGDATSTSASLCAAVAGDGGAYPRQDARYGRDANLLLQKIGDGSQGFDFTKIDKGDCVRDNVTGLTWEVKANSGLRDYSNTYTRLDKGVGTSSGGVCQTTGRCDTEKYADDVNHLHPLLCGFNDWRVPSVKELVGIANFGLFNPAIDITYFPNGASSQYWTATVQANNITLGAWTVSFVDGSAIADYNSTAYSVRLVRGQP